MDREDAKWDKGKLQYSLILWDFLKLLATILTKGKANHPPLGDGTESWKTVEPEAYLDAMFRHIEAWRSGELDDKDMKTHHMGHIAINAMFLWWMDTYNGSRNLKLPAGKPCGCSESEECSVCFVGGKTIETNKPVIQKE